MKKVSYDTNSELTKDVCEKIGFDFHVRFVEAMERNGKIYVRGTAGKLNEFQDLKKQCKNFGYIYAGKTAR